MQVLLIVLVVFSLLILALILFKLRQVSGQVENLAAIVQAGGAKTLVANIDKVRIGIGKDEVTRLLGPADDPSTEEWFYYLDEYSGYLVKFDSRERVQVVESWMS